MTPHMETLDAGIFLPDLWQRDALQHLRQGFDVIVDAPTGAGKTFIFEKWVEAGLRGKAVFTVPTRALANDKLLEWREKGWDVGIQTGDLSDRPEAAVVVATLETQKQSLLLGKGPDLLVVDEYQMLQDESRGMHYESALASTPAETQLLLLSGSVANPDSVQAWLQRMGRSARIVRCGTRPVPLDEVMIDAVRIRLPRSIQGFWPRTVAKVLRLGMGPLLLFTTHRRSAEDLARRLAEIIEPDQILELTPEQAKLAGKELRGMLRNRIAYHHSGLQYRQRAGLIEPLAKAGQLMVVVATTGLAAGINFSMRSVLVADSEYHQAEQVRRLRPDELLQMFGRAGRRGIDETGYAIILPDRPRLTDARPLHLRPSPRLDWPACLQCLSLSPQNGNPYETLRSFSRCLFLEQALPPALPLSQRKRLIPVAKERPLPSGTSAKNGTVTRMMHSNGTWARPGPKVRAPLGKALRWNGNKWIPALQHRDTVLGIPVGSVCRLSDIRPIQYGRQLVVATFPTKEGHQHLNLTKWFFRKLRNHHEKVLKNSDTKKVRLRSHCSLEELENRHLPLIGDLTFGGKLHRMEVFRDTIRVELDYSDAVAFVRLDQDRQALLNPPLREEPIEETFDLQQCLTGLPRQAGSFRKHPTAPWFELGLIDHHHRPTRRGRIFSFFNHGEGLAIAAALEDESYAVEDLVFDLANLRSGHRFEEIFTSSSRLADCCSLTYGWQTLDGLLQRGVPPGYGNGASEIMARLALERVSVRHLSTGDLHPGDIERARMEWHSLLRHILHAPDLDWDRWTHLKQAARSLLGESTNTSSLLSLPKRPPAQRSRYLPRLRH